MSKDKTEIEKRIEAEANNICTPSIRSMISRSLAKEMCVEMAKFILELPELMEFVKYVEDYLKFHPVDGFHFSDCDSMEDNYEDEMPCSCGGTIKEMNVNQVLSKLKALGIVK